MPKTQPARTRLPRDARARGRLREAQQREAEALAAVYVAESALTRAHARRDAALAAATAVVERAEEGVANAQTALVEVSGLPRASLLLAVDPSDLRKNVGSRNTRRADA
jgi:hypothetical protein